MVFLADISVGLVLASLPLYASSLGATVALVSGISSTIGVSRIISLFYLGNLSDLKGRRFVSAISLVSLAAFALLITFLSNPILLLVASVLNGLTITVFGSVAAFIGDNSETKDVDHRMSMNMAFQGAGFAIGPVLGGFMAQVYGFHEAYYLAAALALAALVAVFRGMRGGVRGPRVTGRIFSRGREVLSNRVVLSVCMLSILTSFSFGCVYTFFPLRGESVGLGAAEIGTILGARTAMSAAARLPVGYLSRRLGRVKLLALTILLPALAAVLIPLTSSFVLLALIVTLEGAGYGIFLTSSRSMMAVTSGAHLRGMAMALLDVFGAFGYGFLVLLVGLGAAVFGLPSAFYTMAIVLLVGGSASLAMLRRALKAESVPARV